MKQPSTDPLLRLTFDNLRASENRVKTSELESLGDRELLSRCDQSTPEGSPLSEDSWAHVFYRDRFRGKKILDFGSGLGFNTIRFAEHGASVTFVDISEATLRVVERICRVKKLWNVSFCYLEDLSSLAHLPNNFDFIYAEGSLMTTPLEVTRKEVEALLEHLRIGGRFVTLGYDWLDIDNLMLLLQPAKFEVVLDVEMPNSGHTWFDLVRVEGSSSPSDSNEAPQQPAAPKSGATIESNILDFVRPVQPDWNSTAQIVDGSVAIETGTQRWAYACAFGLDSQIALDPDRYYWLALTVSVSHGEIGVCLLREGALVSERFISAGKREDVFFPMTEPVPDHLVLRNTSDKGERSRAAVSSARIVSEPRLVPDERRWDRLNDGLAVIPKPDMIFEKFPPLTSEVALGYIVDFIGARCRMDFFPQWAMAACSSASRSTTIVTGEIPAFDEEYYEWVDLLEAVTEAEDEFTMLELGAGFGRWGVRGALAARRKGIVRIRLGLVEPEPVHLEYLRQHLLDNDIPLASTDIYAGAVSDQLGETYFFVRQNLNSSDDSPRDWYGQAKVDGGALKVRTEQGGYHGRPLYVFGDGAAAIAVRQFQASKLIRNYRRIDLVDLDLQGEEFTVISEAMDDLNKRVKRLHIGTHSPEIENALRSLLTANRWECVRDYAGGKTNPTPVGNIHFGDGVQTWLNPALRP